VTTKLGLDETVVGRATPVPLYNQIAQQLEQATTVGWCRGIGWREAELLDIVAGQPVLTVELTSFDDASRCVELGRHIYRTDRYTVELNLVSK
jgi:hypothetical protein